MKNRFCMHVLSDEHLASVTGGQRMPAPSTLMGIGVNAMSLLDHPQKTLDTVRNFLGIPDSGKPGQIYTPATANPDGSINQGRFSDPPSDGPQVPMSQ